MLKRHISKVLLLSVYVYLYTPIFILIGNSFNASKYGLKWNGFTTKWYELLWVNRLQSKLNRITARRLSFPGQFRIICNAECDALCARVVAFELKQTKQPTS